MIKEGDIVVLVGKKRHIVRVKRGMARVGKGTMDLSRLIGKEYGNEIIVWGEEFRIYRPSYLDLIGDFERGAQVILPKDAAQIIQLCDIRAGDRVLEAGSGSGWLTAALSMNVIPDGIVVSYDISKKSIETARRNIEKAGLDAYVEFMEGDIREAEIEGKFSSCVLDMPDPWNALKNVSRSLISGGHVCIYVPTYNQVEESVLSMKEDFFDIGAVELIQRNIEAKKGATRPEFTGLLHTGFIIHGRKR